MTPSKPWGHPGILSDRRHNLHFQECRFFVAPPLVLAFGLGTGPCFACGLYNHIRRQYPHVNRGAGAVKVQSTSTANSQTVTQNRDSLKDGYEFDSDLFTHVYYEYEQGQKHILVRGRLKRNINFWHIFILILSF